MSNVFQRALEEHADRRLSEDPALLAEIWQVRLRLNDGHFNKDWVDALIQPWRGRYDLHDAYGFAIVWSALLKGKIGHAVCDIGQECGPDRDVAGNQTILSSLQRVVGPMGSTVRCRAEFWVGLADADGYFEWLDPIQFSRLGTSITVGPCRLPLEVGSTQMGTTIGHVFGERGLVRWPYRSTRLYLLYGPRNF